MSPILEINDLCVTVENTPILEHTSLTLQEGKIYVIMGPNGSGKSTLANVIMGHPNYVPHQGTIQYKGADLLEKETHERSLDGIFLSFQYPKAIPGVTVLNLLKSALNARRSTPIPLKEFKERVEKCLTLLHIPQNFLHRYVNDGFSGGEKKKMEILQLLLLDPSLAILDETDSGLDIDALRMVASGINLFKGPQKTILIITHYKRILDYIHPDYLFIMHKGKIVHQGDSSLIEKVEQEGYKQFCTTPST